MEVDFRVTGEGAPLLLLHGAAEDLDLLQPEADALAARGFRVVTFDRRGTGGSSRANWPEGSVGVHLEDAADLIETVAGGPATVLGLSSGGVLALALAEQRPDLVREVFAWETPALSVLPDGPALHAQLVEPLREHLRAHPTDWVGGYDLLLTIMSGGEVDLASPRMVQMRRNAEAAVRDDAPLITAHRLHPRLGTVDVVIAVGAAVDPLLAQIAGVLAAGYGTGVTPVPAAFEHEIYLSRPDVLADAVRRSRAVRSDPARA